MKVLTRSAMPDGTKIQIEDWSMDYPSVIPYMIGSYPKSKANHPGSFAPKYGEQFRASFVFETLEEAQAALASLESGNTVLRDYLDKFWDRNRYSDCI